MRHIEEYVAREQSSKDPDPAAPRQAAAGVDLLWSVIVGRLKRL